MAQEVNVLAFDTSSTACSVAIQIGETIHMSHKIAPMQQAQLILSAIDSLLRESSITLEQLDAIVYGCGPGSFTGIRIASSVAQGLGFAHQIPLISVSSLAALAQAAYLEQQWTPLLVAIDARMNQVYWGVYQVGQDGCVELIGQEEVTTPDAIIISQKEIEYYGVGDGWEKYETDLVKRLGFKPIAIQSAAQPTALALLKLAKKQIEQKNWVSATEATSVYLR